VASKATLDQKSEARANCDPGGREPEESRLFEDPAGMIASRTGEPTPKTPSLVVCDLHNGGMHQYMWRFQSGIWIRSIELEGGARTDNCSSIGSRGDQHDCTALRAKIN
jgi:hypothetical protein